MKHLPTKSLATKSLILSTLLLASSSLATGTLRLYTWGGYFNPDTVKKFEKQYDIKVQIDSYGSNEEMIAKLQAGGVRQYDVVVPTDFVVPSMIALKLLQPLDHKAIPNLKNLAKTFASPGYDTGNKYTAAFTWFTVGLIYDKRKFKAAPDSWAVIFDPKARAGSYLLMDSTREMLGAALRYLGKDVNTASQADLQAAGKLLLDAKKGKGSLGFASDVNLKNRVVAGESAVSVGYIGDGLRGTTESPNVGVVLPKEGGTRSVDNLAIPAQAPNKDAANKFINWVLDAKIGAEIANWTFFPTPNAAALPGVKAQYRNNPSVYPPAALLSKYQPLKDVGTSTRLYDEVWTAVKSR